MLNKPLALGKVVAMGVGGRISPYHSFHNNNSIHIETTPYLAFLILVACVLLYLSIFNLVRSNASQIEDVQVAYILFLLFASVFTFSFFKL